MTTSDDYLWLEDVKSDRATAWVEQTNSKTLSELEGRAEYAANHRDARATLLATDRLSHVAARSGSLYNFWQDQAHPRGIWRRTTFKEYETSNPTWDTLLDVDELSRREGEDWVWKGAQFLAPENHICLVGLSRGGLDATAWREFDVRSGKFVADGFVIPAAKTDFTWIDSQRLLVATDYGTDSLTTAGYPRVVELWQKGEPLKSAREIFRGEASDTSISLFTLVHKDERRTFIGRNLTFFSGEVFQFGTELSRIEKPNDAAVATWFGGRLIVQLRGAWQDFPAGSLVALGPDKKELVFAPNSRQAVHSAFATNESLVIGYTDSITGRIARAKPGASSWTHEVLPFPTDGDLNAMTYDLADDRLFATFESSLTPPSIWVTQNELPRVIKSLPARFDASAFETKQNWFISKDGTRVPYFLIAPKVLPPNAELPVLIYGYGGFEVPLTPVYLGLAGKLWLEKGGAFVRANIRGGGEFGPKWHAAALKENRQRAFDDFQGVAEDLIAQRITKPSRIAIDGRSNGGLLVGACLTQRPDLYRAVICGVPLLDMLRYHKLLAGASWMAEYGDPDVPVERAYIEAYSPLQNLRAGVTYPETFFYTSTADDRVHPGHARKMAARMLELNQRVSFFENTVGGHAGANDPEQQSRLQALIYTFLQTRLRSNI